MPADPGKDLAQGIKLPTRKEDVGHVAPSFEKEHVVYNTLVIRPQYRISLRLGNIDELFPWPVDSIPGRLARMQVLGFFYWPLNHRLAAGSVADPSTGQPRKPPGIAGLADNQEAYKVAWRYFKEKFASGGKQDADGDAELQTRLKDWIVQPMNGTEAGGAGGQLPGPAPEDGTGKPQPSEAEQHYAKLRLPGGWARLSSGDANEYTADQSMSGMTMYDPRHSHETNCYKANPGLGKIPLIAKVEKLDPSTNQWKPAPTVRVHFQLIKPYDLPAYSSGRNAHLQLNTPPLVGSSFSVTHPDPHSYASGAGPKYFVELWEKHEFDEKAPSPQLNNCHTDCGGKRKSGNPTDGSDVARSGLSDDEQRFKSLFWVGDHPGFTKAHGAPPAGYLNVKGDGVTVLAARALPKVPSLKPAQTVNDAKHPHCVQAQTNDDGEAGVIFLPSRCGGDRYRFRAYLADDGDAFKSTGDDFKAVRADTGTLVIWRNARLSRWYRQAITEAAVLANKKMANQYFEKGDADAITDDEVKEWARTFGVFYRDLTWAGLPPWSMDTVSDGQVGHDFDGLRAAFARAYCELDGDPGHSNDLSQAEWKAAVDNGLADAKRYQSGSGATDPYLPLIDLDAFCFRDAANSTIITDGISVATGFCCPTLSSYAFDERNWAKNNNHQKLLTHANANTRQALRGAVDTLIDTYFLRGFARQLAQNGFLPGVTFIQAMSTTSIEAESGYDTGCKGYSMPCYAAYVMCGQATYRKRIGAVTELNSDYGNQPADQAEYNRGYMVTVIHELGHCLFKVHAPGLKAGSPASGVRGPRHDSWGHFSSEAIDADGEPAGQPIYDTCLMSYRNCDGMFCGRCLLELRGWNILAELMMRKKVDPAPPNAVIGAPVLSGPVATAPAVPTDLKAVAGDKQVQLTWKAADRAASYKVKRGTVSGTHTDEIASNVRSLSFADKTVANATRYYYVVIAVNGIGESGKSNEADATPSVPAAKPTNLAATAGNERITLNWTAVVGASAYNIKRSEASGGPYDAVVAWEGSPPYTNTGLKNGTRYYYVVSAQTTGGEGPNSDEASATPAP